MNDTFVRAVKTFVQAFLATMISEFYILLEMDAVHFFGQDMFITLAPVICAGLAAGFSAVGNAIHGKLFPEKSMDFEELVRNRAADFYDSEFRQFVYRLTAALLDYFPEDASADGPLAPIEDPLVPMCVPDHNDFL